MLDKLMESRKTVDFRQIKRIQDEFLLSNDQIVQILDYVEFIIAENKKVNLTGYKETSQILSGLFVDSLGVSKVIDISKLTSICDVGTGAGFPGLALKIMFPELKVFLIELTTKKINFLQKVIKKFNMQNVEIINLDWRTFNRKTNFDIDLFLSKAAFGEIEICRMFRENCNYKNKSLVYWVSESWECNDLVKNYLHASFSYKFVNKKLNFAEFKKKPLATI